MNLFYVPLIAYITVAFIKFLRTILNYSDNKGKLIRKSFGNGGFPSSHNAIFFSIATVALLKTGLSITSTIALWLALTIASDSYNTRGAISKNSIGLNKLTHSKNHDEHVGHSWLEIISGAILGIIIAFVCYYLF